MKIIFGIYKSSNKYFIKNGKLYKYLYSNLFPSDTWRSSMSIPRKISLGHHNLNYVTKVLYLNQEPVLEHDFFQN